MSRSRLKTKNLAQRIDLSYFKRPHPFRRLRFILSVAAPLVAILWLGWYAFARDNHVYSGGRVSTAHAILSKECSACHVKQAGVFSARATNQGCESCHDGPIHHTNQVFTPNCASCHEEHRGHLRLAAVSQLSCTQCHANLQTTGTGTHFAHTVTRFDGDHPEFAALRAGNRDPGTIKFNHAVHLKHSLLGPSGSVDLDCQDCHRSPVNDSRWKYGTPGAAAPAASGASPNQRASIEKSLPPSMDYRRAYMTPVAYAKHCAACHGLQFDPRFQEGAPHDTPQVIHSFLVRKFQEYIASHSSELRIAAPVPERDLPQRPLPVAFRILTQQQWVDLKVAESEELLWRKTCAQCHALSFNSRSSLPVVASSSITPRWFQHAVFDHDTHKLLECAQCHVKAPTSQESSDVLIPGIQTCQTCHHAGSNAAESRCFECHTYHNWEKGKEVRGSFVLERLGRGN